MSQTDTVLKLLRKAKSHGVANYTFFNNRILRASERIRELKADGYTIVTSRDRLPNGKATNVYRYTLIEEETKKEVVATIMKPRNVKIAWWHKRRIRSLFKDRYGLEELYLMYKEVIPYNQLRGIVQGVRRNEKI